MKMLPDSPALAQLKWRYYQYHANCQLFSRQPERVGQWFINRYVKSGEVYTTGCGTLSLFYAESPTLCWRTIKHWLNQHCYVHSEPQPVREV